MIGQTVSHYRILERIGTGGMGAVYKAEDTRLGVHVVLKFLHAGLVGDERAKKRFIHEAQAASALDHPNICAVHGIDETPEGQLFIAMRYYSGESLKERIARRGPLPVRESFQIAFSIAQGLSAAHRRGVTHRDVKPANVVITTEGFVKILDFGLAKIAGRTQLTASDTTLGTVSYMSPEQAGARDVDTRTDIWSLGVVLYEMLTGRLPFKGDIDQAMVYSILSLPHVPVQEANPEVPDDCAAVIDRCLEKDPDLRYQSAEELLEDIVALSRGLGWGSSIAVGSVVPVSGEFAPQRPGRGSRRGFAVAAILAVLAVVAGWWFTRGEPSPYTTDLRVAVMPVDNKTDPSTDPLVAGLSEIVSDMLETLSDAHPSMWVVPYSRVAGSGLATPDAATRRFGVNRVIAGDIQRFGDNRRLTLDLRDAGSLETIRSAYITFRGETLAALADSLPLRLRALVGIDARNTPLEEHWPAADPAKVPYLYGTGYLRDRDISGYLANAVASLTEAARMDSTCAMTFARLGTAHFVEYLRSRDDRSLQTALDCVAIVDSLEPQVPQAYIHSGYVLARTGRTDRAIAAYRAALRFDPGNEQASLALARIYERQDRAGEAEATLKQSIERHPDYPIAHRSLGLFYHREGMTDEAMQQYQRALELAPEDPLTLNNLGAIYHSRGQWARARSLFERSFRLDPNCDTSSNLGLLLYYEGRFEESASYYEFALQYCDSTLDDYYQSWGNWAKALYWSKDPRASSAYERAIALGLRRLEDDNDDPMAIANLIDFYTFTDQREKTFEMVDRGRRVAGDNKDVLFSIGNAYEWFGERETALRYIGDAIRHGYPVAEIKSTPLLENFLEDRRFLKMIEDAEDPDATSR